jgi:hypothetical protein
VNGSFQPRLCLGHSALVSVQVYASPAGPAKFAAVLHERGSSQMQRGGRMARAAPVANGGGVKPVNN